MQTLANTPLLVLSTWTGVLAVPPVAAARHVVATGVCVEGAPEASLTPRQGAAVVLLAAVGEGEDTGSSSHCRAGRGGRG